MTCQIFKCLSREGQIQNGSIEMTCQLFEKLLILLDATSGNKNPSYAHLEICKNHTELISSYETLEE